MWEQDFTRALRAGHLDTAIDSLDRHTATEHAGTPPSAVKRKALALIREMLPRDTFATWVPKLLASPSATARELAAGMLEVVAAEDARSILPAMIGIADDDNWEVRETAAVLFARVLLASFDANLPLFRELARHPSVNVRRAVVVGAKYVAKERKASHAEALFSLIEPLMSDPNEYIRKNLGPFAIGDGLLRCFPAMAVEWLKTWSRSDDEMVRWNVAMAFSTAEARKHLDVGLPILEELAGDGRRLVWRAAAAALKNHARKLPELVRPTLERMMSDPARRAAAEVVEKYLE